MACEWGGSGVRVTTLAAGPWQAADANHRMPPAGRAITPQDVAATAAFLLSPDAAYVTGTTLVVDGGATVHAGL